MLQILDDQLVRSVNSLAGKHDTLDMVLVGLFGLYIIKSLPITLCIVWLWFDERQGPERRSKLAEMLIGSFGALVVSRVIQNLISERPRPILVDDLDIVSPTGLPQEIYDGMSSFPSDNAALAFALAFGIWRVWRPIGAFALCWAAVVICFPRIFAGLHYMSDIVAGAIIGIASVVAATRLPYDRIRHWKSYQWLVGNKPLLYSLLFMILFLFTTMFEDVREIAQGAFDYLTDDPGIGP